MSKMAPSYKYRTNRITFYKLYRTRIAGALFF